MSIAAIVLSMPSHLTDLGFSAMDASFAIAMTTLMGAIAKPVMGKLSDHMNKKLVMAIAIGLQATGLFLLLSATDYQAVLIAGFLFGFGYGGVAPLWGVLLATRYGPASFAQIMGANMPMLTPFNITGLPFATFIYGLYGSYVPAYATLLGGYVIAAISLALFHMTPRPQNTVTQA
jgi:MFS family permease